MAEIEKNQAIVFVENQNIKQKIIGVLERLSYRSIIFPSITDNSIEQVKSASYKVIILEDSFQNIPFIENPVYQQVIHMAMPLRRNIFFVLLSNGITYPDLMGAFTKSANLLLDIEKIKEEDLLVLLQRDIFRYFQCYEVYNMTKKQINQRGSYIAA